MQLSLGPQRTRIVFEVLQEDVGVYKPKALPRHATRNAKPEATLIPKPYPLPEINTSAPKPPNP